jgi:hypothetical protein
MSTTLHEFIQWMATPIGWDHVFEWPPDVFAVTSAFLKRTGAYRYVVSPPGDQEWPPPCADTGMVSDWLGCAEDRAVEWLKALGAPALPDELDALKTRVEAAWETPMDDFYELDRAKDSLTAWGATEAILQLHAIADQACAGFGTPMSPRSRSEIQFRADNLLALGGSLSRLPRIKGLVLPKMRTPQSGLTLRANSLYATWHETEVDVQWRSVPWVNPEENTLNVLVLPLPADVEPIDFVSEPHPAGQRTGGKERFFSVHPARDAFDADAIVDALDACHDKVSRVHIIAMPEIALSSAQLRMLKETLARRVSHDRIPMIVCGVRDGDGEGVWCNAVVLSVFFAERWYMLRQDKHHRWKLDQRQVRQYRLGGTLASDCNWWEHMRIRRRKLSILAPTGWLALCPLICEDMAQLEPVAEVIRGIGPTLVIGLLMDGPQLPHRWAARYASVLADDPGSSVLTLTALGMCRRSLAGDKVNESPPEAKEHVVAAWRDCRDSFRTLALEEGNAGLLLTLSAQWRQEFTVDGRHDDTNAAAFTLSGVHQIKPPPFQRRNNYPVADERVLFGEDEDLIQLTTASQIVDAVVDASSGAAAKIFRRAVESTPGEKPDADYRYALSYVEDIIARLNQDEPETDRWTRDQLIGRWSRLVELVRREMDGAFLQSAATAGLAAELSDPLIRKRSDYAVGQALLWAVQNRLQQLRRNGSLTKRGADLQTEVLQIVRRDPPDLTRPAGTT